MRTYENREGITGVKLESTATVYCPLGKNYEKARVICQIKRPGKDVDFLDLEDFFKNTLNGERLTTEQLCSKVYELLEEAFSPDGLKVTIVNESHIHIEVTRES